MLWHLLLFDCFKCIYYWLKESTLLCFVFSCLVVQQMKIWDIRLIVIASKALLIVLNQARTVVHPTFTLESVKPCWTLQANRAGSRGLMVKRVGLVIQRLWVRVSGPAGIVVGGVNVQLSLLLQYHDWGALEQGTEPTTAPRALEYKWLPTAPGVCSQCVCVCALRMG